MSLSVFLPRVNKLKEGFGNRESYRVVWACLRVGFPTDLISFVFPRVDLFWVRLYCCSHLCLFSLSLAFV